MKNKLPLIAAVVFIVAVLAFVVGRMTVGNPQKDGHAGKAAGTSPVKVWTRGAFRLAVFGKTPEMIIEAVGRKPDSTQENNGFKTWYYEGIKDEDSGKVGKAQITFNLSHSISVSFY